MAWHWLVLGISWFSLADDLDLGQRPSKILDAGIGDLGKLIGDHNILCISDSGHVKVVLDPEDVGAQRAIL